MEMGFDLVVLQSGEEDKHLRKKHNYSIAVSTLGQGFLSFWAPRTGFIEDNFSMGWWQLGVVVSALGGNAKSDGKGLTGHRPGVGDPGSRGNKSKC